MTTPTPQRPDASPGDARDSESRAPETGVGTGRPGGVDRGLFGDLKQNLTNQWKVQDR